MICGYHENGHDQLKPALAEVIDLLKNCKMSNHAAWFSERLEVIDGEIPDKTLMDVAREVRSVIAGMGEYSELSFLPSDESGISELQAKEWQWKLADEMDAATVNP